MTEPVIVPSLREAFAYSAATKGGRSSPTRRTRSASREACAASLRARAYVTRSLPEFVEVLDPAVDKGEALRFVAARLGVAMEETVAIGDSWNDAPLLEAAGFGDGDGLGAAGAASGRRRGRRAMSRTTASPKRSKGTCSLQRERYAGARQASAAARIRPFWIPIASASWPCHRGVRVRGNVAGIRSRAASS